MLDDLRWSWCANNRNKMHSKGKACESSPNHPPLLLCGRTVFHETGPSCQKGWGALPYRLCTHLSDEWHPAESSSRFSHVGLRFLSTGAAVNSSESLPPSSSVNDISSMSTDQTLASDTDSSLEASAGPLGCCRWLAACLRNPAFFRRWCDGTHTQTLTHTRKRRHTMTRTWQGRESESKIETHLSACFFSRVLYCS